MTEAKDSRIKALEDAIKIVAKYLREWNAGDRHDAHIQNCEDILRSVAESGE